MASKRAQRRKACGTKVRYADADAAFQSILSLKRRTKTNQWFTAYRCDFCGGFHFGHPPHRVRQGIAAHARRKGPALLIP